MRFFYPAIATTLFLGSALLAQVPPGSDAPLDSASVGGALKPGVFVNPIAEGADPWVIRDPTHPRYLWCQSQGNRGIAVHPSKHLTSLGPKHVVWRAPDSGPVSREIWAPELHFLDGKWVIYFAASDGTNANHLAYALQSKTENPLGDYTLLGPFATGEGADGKSPNIWAIDMTPLEHGGNRYALWSGWDAPGTDRQFLYIAPMKSATELAGPRVQICSNDDYPWEFTEDGGRGRGLNEGPQVIKNAGRTFVTYSCGGSWLPTYKLGMLELTGSDPLDPESWKKLRQPVFASTNETFGVGHSCFVKSPDGKEWWHVFHAKRDRRPGWRRAVFVQPFGFNEDGSPRFGKPMPAGEPLLRPSGEKRSRVQLPLRTLGTADWNYYGHHQFYKLEQGKLQLGIEPKEPINGYRCGEKAVIGSALPNDLEVAVSIEFGNGAESRDAGILFRCSGASIGYDAQRGYFAGLIPKSNLVILGKTDGKNWKELARAEARHGIDSATKQKLRVKVAGDTITVYHNGQQAIEHKDATYKEGTIGLRVVDTAATFGEFSLEES